ncbi:fatty acid desaturase [Nannocystis sp.]|uniref:fatty acid desaturase n=1 Tax=Nannocystis sp. TaxID=1962667 RepID=UPI0025F2A8D2|nr:fatty acid desaturase [Nannocystis sp.]MBK7827088.1 fatty acid desaturase [Nannocystis sp.]
MSDPAEETSTTPRVRAIARAIRGEEQRLRAGHPWLAHQDAIGMACFLASVAAMAAIAWAYLSGALPWWAAILLMPAPISILHELEHDLIHELYFKGRRAVQGLMFLTIAWAKLNGSPWFRRGLHLYHHKRSGQRDDIEERLIGIGLRASWYRVLIAVHPIFSGRVVPSIQRANPEFRPDIGLRTALPQFIVFGAVLFAQPALALLTLLAPELAAQVPAQIHAALNTLMVLLVAPNVLRQASLALISSYCHYYEDIPEHDIFYQNQILDHWALVPMQLLCWNFGATHIIHHFVPGQPFYLRQMVAHAAHAEMLRQGVRHNDLDIVRRNNRWGEPPPRRH